MYSHNGNDANNIQDENHDLQHANDQEEEITSINTLRTQPTDNNNGANGDEIRAILEDTNKDEITIDEIKVENNPHMAAEEDDNIQIDPQDQFYVAGNVPRETNCKNKPSTENLQIKSILRIPTSTLPHTIDYMSYAEYDAFKKAIQLAKEMNTLNPSMFMYIDHSFDPANIQYMTEAMPIPYPTSDSIRKVTFENNNSKDLQKLEEKPVKPINNLNHKLLSLYIGLSNRMSQTELNIIQTTEQLARL